MSNNCNIVQDNFAQQVANNNVSLRIPAGGSASIARGKSLFSSVGCSACHTPSLQTGSSSIAAFNNKPVNLYSDLALHHMGPLLADGITQGAAGGDQFRTAPFRVSPSCRRAASRIW